jgi:hypothetical protein
VREFSFPKSARKTSTVNCASSGSKLNNDEADGIAAHVLSGTEAKAAFVLVHASNASPITQEKK